MKEILPLRVSNRIDPARLVRVFPDTGPGV
jgi:hypothetical protein